jgi:hypothetical protein
MTRHAVLHEDRALAGCAVRAALDRPDIRHGGFIMCPSIYTQLGSN